MHSRRPSGGGREFARVGPSARRWRLRGAKGGPGPARIDLQTTGASRSGAREDRATPSARMPERAGKKPAKTTTAEEKTRGSDVVPEGEREATSPRVRRTVPPARRLHDANDRGRVAYDLDRGRDPAFRGIPGGIAMWREKKKREGKKKRENGGSDDGVARTCCGGILGGTEGDPSEDAPKESPGHGAWVRGRRDVRSGEGE